MAEASWSPAAETDLQEIVIFISVRDNRRETAHRVYDDIKGACQKRSAYPLAGQRYPEFGVDVRGFSHLRWLVLYRPTADGLEVLAVVDSARDFASYFAQRPLPEPPDAAGAQ